MGNVVAPVIFFIVETEYGSVLVISGQQRNALFINAPRPPVSCEVASFIFDISNSAFP